MFLAALRPGGDVAIIAALGRLRTRAGEEQHKRSAEQAQRAVPGGWGSGDWKRHRGVTKGGGPASVRREKFLAGRVQGTPPATWHPPCFQGRPTKLRAGHEGDS